MYFILHVLKFFSLILGTIDITDNTYSINKVTLFIYIY